ncbi:thioesterase-like superfamily-domain-containing protein [Mycena belliarum]|uniref:Thioesterase-like superfamily-domain-containing protein n=1 Tax=Mycena belliarum TaxID=1033014 RepID=A0AAD6TZU8_9AGAR|nr:thioesterase-like superfamily-domain-containing protein [Mycena belliae]
MAPLRDAIRVQERASNDPESSLTYYTGEADPEWVVGSSHSAQIGYILSLIVQACIQKQAGSAHPDPLHVSAHFLQATKRAEFEVRIRILKRGKRFVNILADLVQEQQTRTTTHLIFGANPPSPRPLIDPASGYARRYPLRVHPSNAVLTKVFQFFRFRQRLRWAEDPGLLSRNSAMGGSGLARWGGWVELVGEEERITPASLAFLADCVQTFATLVPSSVTGVNPRSLWLPSLTLSVEYKAPIPAPSALHAARTVGVYLFSGYMSAPQGRHDTCLEIWTAPSGIGEGKEADGWRDTQVCLAVATQMQLMVSATVNEAKGKM